MTFIDGCMAAVPKDKKAEYQAFANKTAAMFKAHGAIRATESWGVDVPDGKLTSMPLAVQAKDDEVVVFSWTEWPDKQTRDAAWAAMEKDMPEEFSNMPFDGKRMIFGGFEIIVDT